MDNNICFLVSIRQRICQSGVPVNIDRSFTNVANNTTFELLNGYRVTIYRISNCRIRYTFVNDTFGFNFSFDVDESVTTAFDLPIDSGTFRILIFACMRCCNPCPCSS